MLLAILSEIVRFPEPLSQEEDVRDPYSHVCVYLRTSDSSYLILISREG